MTETIKEWLLSIVKSAVSTKLYGSIILKFENGKITHVKTEKTIKPPDEAK